MKQLLRIILITITVLILWSLGSSKVYTESEECVETKDLAAIKYEGIFRDYVGCDSL